MIDVSIIIVNYNTTALTKKCIQVIKQFTKANSYEIILVDNASPDRSIVALKDEFTDVKFIFNDINIGFGRANNLGIDIAKGKYLFLLNSDAFLLSDAIAQFYDFMENPKNADAGCCGADLYDANMKRTVSYGNFPSILEAFSSIGFSALYKQYYKRYIHSGVINYSDETRVVDYLCGADMFLRKAVIDKVGKFDPDFFLYFEETELSYRIKKSGYRSYLLPAVKILHLEGASQPSKTSINLNKVRLFSKSRSLYFQKCNGKIIALIVKFLYCIKALIQSLVSRNKEYLSVAKITLSS